MATYNCLTAQDYRYQASKVANEIESFMLKWQHWADQLATIPAQDLTDLGLTEGEQTQMGSMRTDVVALVTYYNANLTTFVKRHAQLHVLG